MFESGPLRHLTASPTFGLSTNQRRILRRGALWVLLGSVAVSALLGCLALLGSDFGETGARLLLSTFTVFGASVVTMACGLAWERGRLGAVPPIGIALGLVGFVLLMVLIWAEPDTGGDWLWRAFTSEVILAVAATHASLVAVVTQERRLSTLLAFGLNAVGTLLSFIAIWGEPGDGFWRFYGVVMVLLIAVTIAIPVLRRLEGARAPAAGGEESGTTAARFCPNCGERLQPPGDGSCAACGARFTAHIVKP